MSQILTPTDTTNDNPLLNANNDSFIKNSLKNDPLYSHLYGNYGLQICHLNIRSIVNKIDEIKSFLSNGNVQILTLSESWMDNTLNANKFHIPGYHFIRQDRNYKINPNKTYKRSGGLAMYIRDDISVDVKTLSHLNNNQKFLEVHWVILKFDNINDIILGNFYRPPKGDMTLFIDYLTDLCSNLKQFKNYELFAVGDFNINIAENTNDSRMLLNCMKLCNLNQIINECTRLGNFKNTTFDHIYTNSTNVVSCSTGMLNVSDHMLIYVTRKKAKAKRKVEYIFKRKITDEKIPLFKSDIANHDWSSLYTLTNTTDMWNGMLKTINHYADIHFPIKKKKKK